MSPQQIDATIALVRAAAEGDPLDDSHALRGHLAIVLGALDEARRERDEATRRQSELIGQLDAARAERDEANETHAALSEHVVACLPYEAETDGEALDAWECVDVASREIARLQRERDEAREALAREREACAQQIAEFFSDDAHKGHLLAQYLRARATSPAPAPVAADVDAALATIDEAIRCQFGLVIDGRTIKGYTPDRDEPGLTKCYLDADDCRALSAAFGVVADALAAARKGAT